MQFPPFLPLSDLVETTMDVTSSETRPGIDYQGEDAFPTIPVTAASELVRFEVLGPVRVSHCGHSFTPSAPKVLQVLALLVLRANQIVQTGTLIRQLWGDNPPRSSLTTIQTYIYQLRRSLEREGLASRGEDLVVTQARGYILRVQPEQVDVQIFQKLSDQGRVLLGQRRYADAVHHLKSALALCAGAPLANVQLDWHLAAYAAKLEEQQRAVLQLRIQAEIELGMHRELIGELRSLAAMHPLDEWLYVQLIRVLDRSGRRSEALQAYHQLRANLSEELGLDPSTEVQRLHQQLLRAS
jgi:SARP family transcriptional regulator, regulator of embCAB operon